MLTGRESLAAAFAVTAHRHARRGAVGAVTGRDDRFLTWAQLADDVRAVSLGLVEEGVDRGRRVRVALEDAVERHIAVLAVLAAGGVAVPGEPDLENGDGPRFASPPGVEHDVVDLPALRASGAELDRRQPDAFERRSLGIDLDWPAVALGQHTLTHANLVRAGRSMAQALQADADDRLASTLPLRHPAGIVAGLVLPVLTGATTWFAPRDAPERAVVDARPTLLVTEPLVAARLAAALPAIGARRGPARLLPGGRSAVEATGLDACRRVLVVGDRPDAARALVAAGVPGVVGVAFEGCAGVVAGVEGPGLGRPLPGVDIGIGDDGEVLVRSEGAAPGAVTGGWLHTGRTGWLDDDGLHLGGVAPAAAPAPVR